MSGLNKAETTSLEEVSKLIYNIQQGGFDPDGTDLRSKVLKRDLEIARRRIRTIITMKGYYPK